MFKNGNLVWINSFSSASMINYFLQVVHYRRFSLTCSATKAFVLDVDHALKQFTLECMSLNVPATLDTSSTDQQNSRPSSADSSHDDEPPSFERRLSNLNDEETKQATNTQPIIWDDPFESLTINEQTGRIGLSPNVNPSSSTSRCTHCHTIWTQICITSLALSSSIERIDSSNPCSVSKTTR